MLQVLLEAASLLGVATKPEEVIAFGQAHR